MPDPEPLSSPTSPQLEGTPSIGQRTLGGFGWMVGQAFSGKFIGVASQIFLARLFLDDEDFGAVALASTATAVVGILLQTGVREVLIQRQDRLKYWEGSALVLAISVGIVGFLVMLLAAPLASFIYDDWQIGRLVLVAAFIIPLNSLAATAAIRLQANMKFRAMAIIGTIEPAVMAATSILLASMGAGAYALVFGSLSGAAFRSAAYLCVVRPSMPRRVRWSQVRLLFRLGLPVMGAAACYTAVTQADYFVLGLFHDRSTVGIYERGYNLSIQFAALFSLALATVMLPAFSKLNDDKPRQLNAATFAGRSLALVVVPACLVQAALAPEVVAILYGPRWASIAPVLAFLSVGVGVRVVGGMVGTMILAQGRRREFIAYHAIYAILFVAAVFNAAYAGNERTVAMTVCGFMLFADPFQIILAARGTGRPLPVLWRIYGLPSIIGISVALASFLVNSALAGPSPTPDLASALPRFAASCSAAVVCWVVLLLIFDRPTVADFTRRFRMVVSPKLARWRHPNP